VILAPASVRYAITQGAFMAKRRAAAASPSFKFRPTAPKENTTILSIIIFVLGLIGWVASISFISPYTVWLFAIAYIVLLAGVLMRDF